MSGQERERHALWPLKPVPNVMIGPRMETFERNRDAHRDDDAPLSQTLCVLCAKA